MGVASGKLAVVRSDDFTSDYITPLAGRIADKVRLLESGVLARALGCRVTPLPADWRGKATQHRQGFCNCPKAKSWQMPLGGPRSLVGESTCYTYPELSIHHRLVLRV